MKTGDHVQDGNGRTFQVGQLLGRGLWGKCYLVREEANGTEWVLKVPLTEDELPREPPRLAEVCREIAREQGRLLEESGNEALVKLEARFIADDGSPALLMPRYPETLERRLSDVGQLDTIFQIITQTTDALSTLSTTLPVHGTVKPANVMVASDGSVRLMDPVTPTLRRYLSALAGREGYLGDAYLAPEVRDDEGSTPLNPSADTYALAMILFRTAMAEGEGKAPPALPEGGLEKPDVQVLKDRIHNRLKNEPSNARFHTRLSDRAAAIVNRAISVQTSPSPPYRFNKLVEFRQRFDEVTALVHPTVTHVGKLILNRPPAKDTFATDEEVRFSCTVGASQGVETHEEIAAGLAVFDQERNERLRNLACSYTVDRHPSGRFRFSFRISDLPPAQYLVRVAYTIRDSGHEPATAEELFQVTAAPGYVPPPEEPERQPIAMDRAGEASGTTENTVTAEYHPPGLADPATAETVTNEEDEAVVTAFPSNTEPAPEPEWTPEPAQEPSVEPVPMAINPTPSPAPPAPIEEPDEPEYRGAGRWSELPLPNAGGQDLPKTAPSSVTPKPKPKREPLEQGPVGEALGSLLNLIRGDSYMLFLGAAGVVILALLVILWLLGPS